MVEDAVDYGIIGDEGDDAHLSLAPGADKGINLINSANHLGPAFRGHISLLLSFFHNLLCEYIFFLDFFILTTRFLYDIGNNGC